MERDDLSKDIAGQRSGAEVGSGEKSRGPRWRAWLLTIVVALLLSVATTILLCGTVPFRFFGGADAKGCGGVCCPPAGK